MLLLLLLQAIIPLTAEQPVFSGQAQYHPKVTITDNQRVWTTYQEANNILLVGRDYSGAVFYPAQQVNDTYIYPQRNPEISYNSVTNKFLVSWINYWGQYWYGGGTILGKIYEDSGAVSVWEFNILNLPVVIYGFHNQSLVANSTGWLICAASSFNQEVFINTISTFGSAASGIQINSNSTFQQKQPTIAVNQNHLLTVWSDDYYGGVNNPDIIGTVIDENTWFTITPETRLLYSFNSQWDQINPKIVAQNTHPNFYLVCQTRDAFNYDIIIRKLDSFGIPIGTERLVNKVKQGDQVNPKLAIGPNDSVVVLWENNGDIVGRWVHQNFLSATNEFTFNQTTGAKNASIAIKDDFMCIVWETSGVVYYRDFLLQ